MCARWGPGRGWGPSPFNLPAWLGAGNSPGLSQLVPFLPLQLVLEVGWGGVGRRLFALAPEAGCAPAAFSRHALALPGTPGLRSGTALSGCQASFPISGEELPTLRMFLESVPRKPRLWTAHPPMPRGDSDPGRCPEFPPGHRILELTIRRNVPTSQPPQPRKGPTHQPTGPPGSASVGLRCHFLWSTQPHISPGWAAFHPLTISLKNVLHCWPHACVLLTAALKEPHRRNGCTPQRGSLTTHQSAGC